MNFSTPGATVETRRSVPTSSCLSAYVIASTAALVAQYTDPPAQGETVHAQCTKLHPKKKVKDNFILVRDIINLFMNSILRVALL